MGRALLLRADYDAMGLCGLARTMKHADHALQAQITHQSRDRASGDFNLFPAKLTPDLPHAVNPKVL
ncbi:hypothetical protein ASAP_2433 [Asaia bogorensis]|uniref:Uncharacterized protein n=1 Tax=Asaia bogorensis TaxID=91915 RepID=A0A060QIE3_9PROT|nr:hypothetical protein P792_04770 [Asaia sp. SF2.1]CDG40478.1 hypothetical protein ASAP_2433 [Asaia bogorensis]